MRHQVIDFDSPHSSRHSVTVEKVRAFVFGDDNQEKESGGGADCHKQAEGHWIVDSDIANPMSVYEQYRKSRTSWGIDAMGSVVVEVELSNGMMGVGISIGGDAACYIVEKHLSRFVEGQDPANVELIWDQCWRATINYGRKGIAIQVSNDSSSLISYCVVEEAHKHPLSHPPIFAFDSSCRGDFEGAECPRFGDLGCLGSSQRPSSLCNVGRKDKGKDASIRNNIEVR